MWRPFCSSLIRPDINNPRAHKTPAVFLRSRAPSSRPHKHEPTRVHVPPPVQRALSIDCRPKPERPLAHDDRQTRSSRRKKSDTRILNSTALAGLPSEPHRPGCAKPAAPRGLRAHTYLSTAPHSSSRCPAASTPEGTAWPPTRRRTYKQTNTQVLPGPDDTSRLPDQHAAPPLCQECCPSHATAHPSACASESETRPSSRNQAREGRKKKKKKTSPPDFVSSQAARARMFRSPWPRSVPPDPFGRPPPPGRARPSRPRKRACLWLRVRACPVARCRCAAMLTGTSASLICASTALWTGRFQSGGEEEEEETITAPLSVVSFLPL